jgi:DNA repair protein RadC
MGNNDRKDSKGIVSWPEDERPRERLLSRGPNALTDAELVAILVRVGFEGTSAVELGRKLLKQFGSLRSMAEAPLSALLDIKENAGNGCKTTESCDRIYTDRNQFDRKITGIKKRGRQ